MEDHKNNLGNQEQENIPATEEVPAVEETTAAQEETVSAQEIPAVEETPVAQETVGAEETPVAEETPADEQAPAVGGYTVQNPNPYYTYTANNTTGTAGHSGEFYSRPAVNPAPVKKKKNGLLIALIVVSGLLIVSIVASMVGIGYLVVRSNETETTTEQKDQVVLGDDSQSKNEATAPEVNVVQSSKEDGNSMTTEAVVEKTLSQVVGVVVSTGEGFYGTESQGSGIIFSADGYIITNAHVVEGATSVKIVLPDDEQTTYDAKVVGSDTKTDLAVLKVEATGLAAADIGNSDELKLGETVIAVGNPYGLELQSSVTAGIVSALNRSITTNSGKMNLIQTDAAINPGNSGGALVNLYGQVIGVCSSKISATDAEGLGFAIPINDALPIVKELISKGYISGRPMIGIQGQDISAQTAMMYGVPTGVYVVYVEEDSSAYKAGLRQYDIITEFNGRTITCYSDLDTAKDECKAGDTVSVKFYRYSNGQTYTAKITLSASNGEN